MIKRFFNSFKRFWYLYLIISILSFFISFYLVNLVNMPRNEQVLNIFLATYNTSLDINNIENKLKEDQPKYLRSIDISICPPSNNQFNYIFSNKGLNRADIFILPESKISDELISKQFITLDKEYVSSYFTCEFDDTDKGIKLHTKGNTSNSIFNYIDGDIDEDYYMFYRKNSIHIGNMNNSTFDTALTISKNILKYA